MKNSKREIVVHLDSIDKPWCMCEELQDVYRDGFSTCSICGGKDAYGKSENRPRDKRKTVKSPLKQYRK